MVLCSAAWKSLRRDSHRHAISPFASQVRRMVAMQRERPPRSGQRRCFHGTLVTQLGRCARPKMRLNQDERGGLRRILPCLQEQPSPSARCRRHVNRAARGPVSGAARTKHLGLYGLIRAALQDQIRDSSEMSNDFAELRVAKEGPSKKADLWPASQVMRMTRLQTGVCMPWIRKSK